MARLHVVFILLLWAVPVALAEERILSFHSEIIVEKNGDLLVTEIIKVRVEGVQIERGIYRDLPTRRRGKADPRRFEILSVKRTGAMSYSSRFRLRIGFALRLDTGTGCSDRGATRRMRLFIGLDDNSTSRRAAICSTGMSMARSGIL